MSDFVVKDGLLKEYTGNAEELVIPDNIIRIGSGAFFQRSFRSIIFHEGIEEIDKEAFFNCTKLENISVSENNKYYRSVGGVLFSKDLTCLVQYPSGREGSYEIPQGTEKIGGRAFSLSYALSDIKIPDSVKEIGEGAFYACEYLKSVSIPESIEIIGRHAFADCICFKSAEIKGRIKEIGEGAFNGCFNLKNLEISESASVKGLISKNTDIERYFVPNVDLSAAKTPEEKFICLIHFFSSFDSHSDKDKEMYLSYINKQKKKILGQVIEKDMVFVMSGIIKLKAITVKDIDGFIELANKEKKPQILAMLMNYKDRNFSAAEVEKEETRKQNKELNFDPMSIGNLKKIWSFKALDDCTLALTSYKGTDTEIVVPDHIGDKKVTALGDEVFSSYKSRINNSKIREKITSVIIPEGVTKIGSKAFYTCKSLSSVVIPKGVTEIGSYAFDFCESLKSAVIPDGVTEINSDTFADCESLTDVIIPAGVTKIGHEAFYGCKNLASVTIPEGVTEIGDYAFSRCEKLTIHAPAGSCAEQYAKENEINFEAIN